MKTKDMIWQLRQTGVVVDNRIYVGELSAEIRAAIADRLESYAMVVGKVKADIIKDRQDFQCRTLCANCDSACPSREMADFLNDVGIQI